MFIVVARDDIGGHQAMSRRGSPIGSSARPVVRRLTGCPHPPRKDEQRYQQHPGVAAEDKRPNQPPDGDHDF
jgi:hypothetical protein